MGAVEKLRYVIEMKRINDELMEHLSTSLTWVLHYCAKNNLPLPDREKIDQIVDNAIKLTNRNFTSRKSTSGLTEPQNNNIIKY